MDFMARPMSEMRETSLKSIPWPFWTCTVVLSNVVPVEIILRPGGLRTISAETTLLDHTVYLFR